MFINNILDSCLEKQFLNIIHFQGDTTSFICYIIHEKSDTRYVCKLNVSFEDKVLFVDAEFDGVRNKSVYYFNSFIDSVESYYKKFDVGVQMKLKRSYNLKETILDILFLK